MNQLLDIRKNTYYTKQKSDSIEYNRVHEIILIVDEPKYTRTNEGDVVRERGCKEIRFTIQSDKVYDNVIEIFTKYKDAKEEDLR
jgi:hypothetical protein